MSMAKRVRRFPGLTNSQACTMARKQFDQGVITQRLTPFGPLATHQKNKGTLTISRALLHHIGTDSLQRFRFKQVNNTLHTRFCASTLWMICPISDRSSNNTLHTRFCASTLWMICPISDNHPFSSILQVFQVQRKHLTWSESSL